MQDYKQKALRFFKENSALFKQPELCNFEEQFTQIRILFSTLVGCYAIDSYIKNCYDEHQKEFRGKNLIDIFSGNGIYSAFDWTNTPEGIKYWSEINKVYEIALFNYYAYELNELKKL